ncbi:MAG: hypothetical protein HYV45_03755 [Candidatus Moranbacteria bacterium]|nr:hypothetical protein [Candidatus Moranbacteria bacterium]
MKKILAKVKDFFQEKKVRDRKSAVKRDNIRVSEEQMLYSEMPGGWWQEQ